MLIQNASSAAPAPKLAGESVPSAVVAPETGTALTESPQTPIKPATVKAEVAAPPAPAQVQSAVNSINNAMKQINADIEFSIDKDTQKTVIKVVKSSTGDVIRQIPSDEILAIARAIDNMQQGFLVKQKA